MLVTIDPTLSFPAEAEDGFQVLLAGGTKLASDGSEIDLHAYHQFTALPEGFVVELCALFPAKTPKEPVDGHRLHMAMEFSATLELLAAAH